MSTMASSPRSSGDGSPAGYSSPGGHHSALGGSGDVSGPSSPLSSRSRRGHHRQRGTIFSVPTEDSDSESDHQREGGLVEIPFLWSHEKVKIDDDATYVLVFPRYCDEKHPREHPWHAWTAIFGKGKAGNDEPSDSPKGHMDVPKEELHYQEKVRKEVLQVLKEAGFQATCIKSIDDDEVFLKLTLNPEGQMIKKVAETYHHRLPIKAKCYEQEKAQGTYVGNVPMKNNERQEVLAFLEYSKDTDRFVKGFEEIDVVRLATLQLHAHLNLDAMKKQKVISRHFPSIHYKQVKHLSSKWAEWKNISKLPDQRYDNKIRGYFGEEMAFFFRWTALYVRQLAVLSMAAVPCIFLTAPSSWLLPTQAKKDQVKVLFGIFVVIWESIFHRLNKQDNARASQTWGQHYIEHYEVNLPDFNPKLVGSRLLKWRAFLNNIGAVLFLLTFAKIVGYVQMKVVERQALVLSLVIKISGWAWRRMAGNLEDLQNHRNQTRWNNAIINKISIVKLVVVLYPFFYTAFLMNSLEAKCDVTLSAVAQKVYANQAWPTPGNISVSNGPIPREDPSLSFLNGGYYYFDGGSDQICISGCYPVECSRSRHGGPWECANRCERKLQRDLIVFYLVHTMSTMCCLAIPIITTRYAMMQELKKSRSRDPNHSESYTLLQLQAKCRRWAAYEFGGWGGSYVEDFLQMAQTYALLACFSIINPLMTVVAFLCLALEYRMHAYRMTWVTCRPHPRGATGIGPWQDVFEGISVVALTFNMGLIVRMLLPVRALPLWKQLVIFVMGEKAMLALCGLVSYLFADVPDDVIRIEDFNVRVKKKLRAQLLENSEAHGSHPTKITKLDIGLETLGDEVQSPVPGQSSANDSEDSDWDIVC